MELNLVTNVVNGLNFFKIGHFLSVLSKFSHFGVKNDVISSKIGEIFFSNFFVFQSSS